MGRKGGGRKGFMKSVKGAQGSDSEEEQPVTSASAAAPPQQPAGESKAAKPDPAEKFKPEPVVAPAPEKPEVADATSDDVQEDGDGGDKEETKGQMLQRHKRVRGRASDVPQSHTAQACCCRALLRAAK